MAHEYLTKTGLSEELEEEFGVPVGTGTLDQWNTRGYGPHRSKIGGRVLYPRAGERGVDRFIEDLRRSIAGDDEAA